MEQSDGGRFSVAFPRRWWYPVCTSAELCADPVAFSLMETPLVAFRAAGGAARVVLDRCPHRNVPLSLGRVRDGCLECRYHGWRFDGHGVCRAVPGLVGARSDAAARSVPTYPAREQGGFVWVWAAPESPPTRAPFAMPDLGERGCGEVVLRYDIDATVHAACENDLDVPHTAFLHGGLWRGGATNEITAVRRPVADGVEVQYLGEPVGMSGLRLRGRTFEHWDRFFLPSISQIEYRVEGLLRVVNTVLHLPLAPFRTRAWFDVRFWSRLPASVVRPIVWARGWQIARQDVAMLARQTETVRRFGGEHFASTELDLMGNAIWRLLRAAERAEDGGEADGEDTGTGNGAGAVGSDERTVTFRA